MRKLTFLFAVLLSLVGVTQVKAEAVTESFEDLTVNADNMGLSNGWVVVGTGNYVGITTGTSKDFQYKNGYANTGSYSIGSQFSCSSWIVCPVEVSGDVTFYAHRYSSSSASFKVATATKNDDTYAVNTSAAKSYSLTTSYQQFTFSAGDDPVYVAFQSGYSFFDDVTYTPYEAAEGPALAVKDGSTKLTSPYAYNFGLAVAGTTKTFTLSNPGTEALGVSVSETGNFGATLSATTIAAGGDVTLTVTMPEATGSSAVTISSTADGIDDFVINVSGTIRDENKVFETLLTGAIPEDWTTSGTWTWSTTNGASNTAWYETSNYRLITPLLAVAEGETFYFDAQGTYNGYQGVIFEYSADGENWTASGTATTVTLDWQTFAISDIPAGKYYIALHGWHVNLRNFYGGELPKVAKMVVTQPASLDFGVIAENATKTFTIANTGKAELAGIKVVSSDATFAVTNAPATLAAGESAEVTITMSAATVGVFNATITVSATDMEDVTFDVTGCVMPEGAMVVDFEDNQLPTGWGNDASNKWSFGDGKAYATSAAELTTPKLTFKEGDFFVIKATSYDNYDNNYIEVTGSADGSDWTAFDTKKFVSRSQIPYGSYANLIVADVPTTVKYIKIKGYYVRIEEIAGLTYDEAAPVLTVAPAEAAAFGKVKAQPEAKTYTVTNTGTGTLEGTITSNNAAFTVSKSEFSLAKGESLDFEIALVFDENYGEKAATITIHPTNEGLADVMIAATATTADPNVWEEDFADGIPSTWINDGWTTNSWRHTGEAYASYGAGYLVTPRLEATEGATLQFDVIGTEDGTSPLVAEWANSRDGEWTEIAQYTKDGTKTFTAPADGYYYLRFSGRYVAVDNFYGFKEALLPHDASLAASNVPATGNQYVAYTATVTVKELAGKDEAGVVATLYVDEVAVATDTKDLTANGTTTFTLTYTPDEAVENASVVVKVAYEDVVLATEEASLTITAAPVLSEDETLALETGTYPVVKLHYSLKAGWNTIVLPFAVSDLSVFGEGVKAYQFTRNDEEGLGFSQVTNLMNAEPYLLYAAEAKNEFTFTDVTVNSVGINADYIYRTQSGITFQGVYAPVAAGEMQEGQYGVTTDGRIMKAGAGASLKALHAYFETVESRVKGDNTDAKEDTVEEGAEVKYFTLGAATGISGVEAGSTDAAVFNLAGQRILKTQRGINIVNGRKVVVK